MSLGVREFFCSRVATDPFVLMCRPVQALPKSTGGDGGQVNLGSGPSTQTKSGQSQSQQSSTRSASGAGQTKNPSSGSASSSNDNATSDGAKRWSMSAAVVVGVAGVAALAL